MAVDKTLLDEIVRRVLAVARPDRIRLFGSAAAGGNLLTYASRRPYPGIANEARLHPYLARHPGPPPPQAPRSRRPPRLLGPPAHPALNRAAGRGRDAASGQTRAVTPGSRCG